MSDPGGNLLPSGREQGSDGSGRVVGPAIVAQGTTAADEFNAAHSLGSLPAANGDQPHFAGSMRVSASTGRPIEIGNFNDASTSGHGGLFSQRKLHELFRRHDVTTNLTILKDDLRGQFLGPSDHVFVRRLQGEVNRGRLLAEMYAARFRSGHPQESLRENMLARVLLHEVGPSPGINLTGDLISRSEFGSAMNDMEDPLPLRILNDINDTKPAEKTDIMRLTSSGWVERRAIQYDGGSIPHRDEILNARGKCEQSPIRVVKSLGHRWIC